ncbi:FtsX-like permease family protein [Dactylosporangium aurantiacum]|uniref:FtsX-like permease family protein n=1 Tax=Dactylosporangium aurantiacum TaxID=35754 RepID=A0A9Q9MER5_9ACTN|nr:FtsX-like permease family protein [Dactylosporangium aurantiacum]MDG6105231.1 FtsX-like permease family protein [Dactylosporangium aurantiacum]UWZ51745.1 FtsX-like permease family protein [Dactylosporangium aurantiacum]
MRTWLVPLRIARREARRAKGRTTLVLALILLPVLGLSFAAVTYDMFTLTPAERLDRELGRFEGSVRWQFGGPVTQDAEGYSVMSPGRAEPPTPSAEGLLALLPAGSRVALVDEREVRLRGGTGEQKLPGHQLDLADAAYRGRVALLRGTAPASTGEIALNAAAMRLLGVRLGGTVRLPERGDLRVVAEMELPENLKPVAVLHPGTLPVDPPGQQSTWLVDTPAPITWDQVRALNQHGVLVRSRAVVLDPPPDAPSWPSGNGDVFRLGVLVFGLGVLEIVLLAGPAFAVGARRRRRELALVAANGGTPAQLRRIVLADGVLLGVVAGVAGTAVAVAAAFALRGVFEDHVAHAGAGGYRVFPAALLGIAGLAFVAGVGAALVPAFAAARTDVVAALAGRRNRTGPGRRWLFIGLGMLGAGAAVAGYGVVAIDSTVVMAGLVLAELGLVVVTPTLVGLVARLGRRLPLAPRIAVRDLARHRSSTAPAISAVMAAVLGAVTIGVFFASDLRRQLDMQVAALPDGYAEITRGWGDRGERADPLPTPRLVQAAAATLPVATTVELRGVTCPAGAAADASCWLRPVLPVHRRCPYRPGDATPEEQRKAIRDPRCRGNGYVLNGGGNATTIVDDGSTVGVVSAARGEDLARAEATLRAGGVVVADPSLVDHGTVLLAVPSREDPEGYGHTVAVPGYVTTTAVSRVFVAMSPQAVAKAGLAVEVKGIVVATSRMPTRAEMGAFNEAAEALGNSYHGSVAWPYRPDVTVELVVLGIVAAVIALGAAGIATGLAAVDSRPDLATLGAVGASPGVRRRLTLSQAGVIAGLGSLLGAAAGLGAGWAVLAALNRKALSMWPSDNTYPWAVPWPNVAVAVLVVPAVAMVGTAMFTRARLPIERRT